MYINKKKKWMYIYIYTYIYIVYYCIAHDMSYRGDHKYRWEGTRESKHSVTSPCWCVCRRWSPTVQPTSVNVLLLIAWSLAASWASSGDMYKCSHRSHAGRHAKYCTRGIPGLPYIHTLHVSWLLEIGRRSKCKDFRNPFESNCW